MEFTWSTFFVFAAAVITLVATSFLIGIYLFFKDLQVLEFKMVILMCLGDFIQTFCIAAVIFWSWILPNSSNNFVCNMFGFFELLGCQMSFIWTAIICYLLRRTVMDATFRTDEKWNVLLTVGLLEPLILALLPLMDSTYGHDLPSLENHDCFIKSNNLVDDLTFGLVFFIPLWGIITYNFVSMTKIYSHMIHLQYCNQLVKDRVVHLFWYPSILFVCWIWSTIYRICNWSNTNPEWMAFLGFMLSSLNGALNAVAYGWNTLSNRLEFVGFHIRYKSTNGEDELEILTPSFFETDGEVSQFFKAITKTSLSSEYSLTTHLQE